MRTKIINLQMTRGDSERIGITITGLDTAPDAMVFSVKKSYSSTAFVVQKTLEDGIEQETSEDADSYVYGIQIEPEDTQNLSYSTYVYDVEITFNGGDRKTLAIGEFKILPDVTTH